VNVTDQLTTRADAITTEIIRNAFIAAAEEMSATLIRSAYNTVISEMKDCSVALLDEEQRVLGQASGIPIFLGNLEICIGLTEAQFGREIWAPGDVWIMNDSYLTGAHLGDVTIFAPIYYGETLVGFSASRTHWLDIGAKDFPLAVDSTEIYHEGLRLGPTKVMENWQLREDIVDILARNSRLPFLLVGDLQAQIAAARTGESRFVAILDRYGVETVTSARDQVIAQNEALGRAAVEAIPDGIYEAEGCLDDDLISNEPFWVRLKLEVNGGEMNVDLSESSGAAQGPLNCGEAQTISACRVAFKRLVNPDRPVTGGDFAPLSVKVRRGSLLAAEEPAACQFYFSPLGLLIDLFVKALAPVMPEKVAAASHGDSMMSYIGGPRDRNGNLFVHVDALSGGWGAWHGSDGESCLINSTNGAFYDLPIEIAESRYPLRVRRYALRPGSVGAGKWRGGCGTIHEFEAESDDMWLSLWYERSKTPAWGLFGGHAGKPPVVEVNPGSQSKRMLKVSRLPLRRGDVVLCMSGGGGGYGDPRERDRGLVEHDLLDGIITTDEARTVYGYGPEELGVYRT
jgi:N-methylhydantoinase B